MTTTTIQARIDTKTKKEAEAILEKMGITLNEGIRMFLHQTVNIRALPFQPELHKEPNKATRQAMQDALSYLSGKNTKGYKSYSSVDDLMKNLLSEKE